MTDVDDPLEAFFQQLSHSPDAAVPTGQGVVEMMEEEGDKRTAGRTGRPFAELPAFLVKPLEQAKELEPVDHATIAYEPFRKAFYRETTEVADWTVADVRELRFQLDQLKVRGAHCPKPVRSWSQCGLPGAVLEGLRALGHVVPTPIQAQALPAIMAGRDLIGVAKTGSGKTLAFVLPLLRHVLDQRAPNAAEGPVAVVLTPTRELALQTHAVVRHFGLRCDVPSLCVYGGVDVKEQIGAMRRRMPSILVATPGRLIDLLLASGGRVLQLRRVTFVVLDEADRLFDLGFGPQVVRIVANVRPDRQCVLFSATFPRALEALARRMLQRPVEILAGHARAVCSDVAQGVRIVDSADDKFVALLDLLGSSASPKVLVFVDRQLGVDVLVKDLRRRGHAALPLHGGMEQVDRDASVADFRAGIARTLVATSVASRGLDVPHIDLVLNYDAPSHPEDYVHRAGRTGRAGRPGLCVTLLTPSEGRAAADLVRALRASNLPVPEDLQALANRHDDGIGIGGSIGIGTGATNVTTTTNRQRRNRLMAGYGGRGLERLDLERLSLLHVQRSLFGPSAIADPAADEGSPPSEPAVEGSVAEGRQPITAVPKIQRVPITEVKSPRPPPPRADLPPPALRAYRQARLAAEAVELAIANRRQVALFTMYDPVALVSAKYKPMSLSSFGGEIMPLYDHKAIFAASHNNAADLSTDAANWDLPEPRGYLCDIDVNDYPASVRLKVTQKETLSNVLMAAGGSGVSLVVKGQYVAPGAVRSHGNAGCTNSGTSLSSSGATREQRLHVRIEGFHLPAVEAARSELQRLLVEAYPLASSHQAFL